MREVLPLPDAAVRSPPRRRTPEIPVATVLAMAFAELASSEHESLPYACFRRMPGASPGLGGRSE